MAITNNFIQKWIKKVPNIEQEVANNKSSLEETKNNFYKLSDGIIKLPKDFKQLPFKIFKSGSIFASDATPYNVLNWSNATNIYISTWGTSDVDGTDYTKPITLKKFREKLNANAYTGTNFILNILDNLYLHDGLLINNENVNLLIRSASPSGFSWLPSCYTKNYGLSEWSVDGEVYKTEQITTVRTIISAINFNSVDKNGIPKRYNQVDTLDKCKLSKGTFYNEKPYTWVNPYEGESINDIGLGFIAEKVNINQNNSNVVVFENIGFTLGNLVLNFDNLSSKFFQFGCRYFRGGQDAFAITGKYNCFSFDCVANSSNKDCFNYHATSTDSLAFELNCKGYDAGIEKIQYGNADKSSNNGSTAHDGMYILRIGSDYWNCEGPIVADIQDCYSISIGCDAMYIAKTTTGPKACFFLEDNNGVETKPKYVIDCYGFDDNETSLGISGTNNTKKQSFNGMQKYNKTIEDIVWNKVVE